MAAESLAIYQEAVPAKFLIKAYEYPYSPAQRALMQFHKITNFIKKRWYETVQLVAATGI